SRRRPPMLSSLPAGLALRPTYVIIWRFRRHSGKVRGIFSFGEGRRQGAAMGLTTRPDGERKQKGGIRATTVRRTAVDVPDGYGHRIRGLRRPVRPSARRSLHRTVGPFRHRAGPAIV